MTDKNIRIYRMAEEYLDGIKPAGIVLEKYFLGDSRDFSSLKDVYVQFISSAQNYQSMPKVIKFDERKERIAELVYGFDYRRIKDVSAEDLYQTFRREFNAGGADSLRNCWHKWSRSVVDSAKFVSEFSDVEDFTTFVGRFDYNVSTRMALPLLISNKICGVGFALACDTLKELGFTNYPKPDVHMMEVFSALGLSKHDPISTFEAIARMSEDCEREDSGITPYKVDKTFWLICSGRFYLENPEINIGRHKKEFIDYVSERINLR